jgi:DNA-binding MarR family transcriptional regulator
MLTISESINNMDENRTSDSQLLKDTLELFWRVMLPLWHIIRAQVHNLATSEYGITSSQFHTIRRISQGDASVSALADCMHVSRPNVSRAVDELVQNGLVNRKRDPDDRRNIQLSLTDKGKKMIKDLHDRYGKILADQFSILTDEELRTLSSALVSMKKVIDQRTQK